MIRRDLTRLEEAAQIVRVHGGAKLPKGEDSAAPPLMGTPFDQSITQNLAAKQAISRAAAVLCSPGEGVMIDGGTTTLQMCPHLDRLSLQLLTNSLHIVNALLPQTGTRILLVDSTKFRTQSGTIVCGLDEIDMIITDSGLRHDLISHLTASGVRVLVADGPALSVRL